MGEFKFTHPVAAINQLAEAIAAIHKRVVMLESIVLDEDFMPPCSNCYAPVDTCTCRGRKKYMKPEATDG